MAQSTCRPTDELKKLFVAKCFRLKNVDGYTTQNNAQIELINMWVAGKIKLPWEKKGIKR